MSSIPVVRRTTVRTTRTMKDTENANSKVARAVTRGKTVGGSATAVAVTSRLTAPTVASKAKTVATDTEGKASKRKREALAEVTAVNKGKTAAAGSKVQEAKEAVAPSKVRTGAVQQEVAVPKKTKEALKPSIRTRVPKVYRDDDPVEEHGRKKDRGRRGARGGWLRASKRRHTETVQLEETSQEEVDRVAQELVEPEAQLWDDLDADDWDDPLMCSEYVKEHLLTILPARDLTRRELHGSAKRSHLGAPRYPYRLDPPIHARFNMLSESLFLTVNLIDRFLGLRPTTLRKLQLVGLACFFIATKFEETCAPSVTEIVTLCDHQYSVEEVLKAERYILQILNWDLRDPGPMSWLRRGSKADNCCTIARTVAKYLLEIGCVERRLVGVLPSHMAAAALGLHVLLWKEIIPIATVMLEYVITNPIQHESLYKKYAHKKYMKCSAYLRQWALERWDENCDIHLERDLPQIKADIVRHHEALAEQEEALRAEQ
ncbi:nime/cyclinb [Coprinopsis sp. MPI-PUGE-AT-0042]|nr:nime/cyclinb [Coprinopsis sp. MPI-PUGE-AT-0042]